MALADPFALANPDKTAADPFAIADKSSPQAAVPEPTPGPFRAGITQGTSGIRAAGGGLLSMVGRGFGVKSLEDRGDEIAANANADGAASGMKIEDVDSLGGAFDFAKYAIGNLMPYALATLALGAGGRAATTVASKNIASMATREYVKGIGTMAGPAAFSMATEAGGIYNDAKTTGVENPLGRSIAGGIAAGLLDTAFPAYIAGKVLGPAAKNASHGFGVRAMLANAGKEGLKDAAFEGGTEGIQTVIERLAAGQPLDNADAASDIINSAAVGAFGGHAIGTVVGAATTPLSAPASANTSVPPASPAALSAAAPAQAVAPGEAEPAVTSQPAATDLETAATPLPSLVMQKVKSEFPEITPMDVTPETLFGRMEELKDKHVDLNERVATLEQDIAGAKGRVKVAARKELATAMQERDDVGQRLSNLTALASLPDYQSKHGSVDNGVLLTEGQKPSSIVTPGVRNFEVVQGQKPGFMKSATELVEEGKIAQRRANIEIPLTNTPRETIKAPDLKIEQEKFLDRAGRVAESNANRLVEQGIIPAESRASTRALIYKGVKNALSADNVEDAKDTIRAGIERAVSRKLLKQDVDGFVDRVFSELGGEQQPDSGKAAPKTGTPTVATPASAVAPEATAATPAAPVSPAAATEAPATKVATPAPAPAAAEPKVDRPAILVLGNVGHTPKHTEPLAIRANPQGGYDLFQGGYQVLDFNTAEPITYPPEASTAQILADVKERSKELFGSKQRFYEDKGGKQFNSQAAVDGHLSELVQQTQDDFADQGRMVMEVLGRLLGGTHRLVVRTTIAAPGEAAGHIDLRPGKDTIAVAVNAKDVLSVAYHEGFHYIEERILDGAERRIIREGMAPGTKIFQAVLARAKMYDHENGTDISSEIEAKPQEAHAYGFEMWKRGELEVKGRMERILTKIREVVERIGNAIKGSGFRSVLDIYRAIDAGEYRNQTPMDRTFPWQLSSRAAVIGMAQQFANGELKPQQLMAQSAKFFDGLDLPKPTVKQVLGIGRESIGGSVKRFYLENIASGTFIARDSRGFGNVFGVLTGHKQRKDFLISQGVDDMLSKWDARRGANSDDMQVVGTALFKRTEGNLLPGSAEYQSLMSSLTDSQRAMFEQASAMIADRLQQEFAADQRTMQGLLGENTPDYAKWFAERQQRVQQLVQQGYVPERRYGDHVVHVTVTVKDKAGVEKPLTMLREQFETEAEARARLLQYEKALEGDPAFKPAYEYKYAAQHDGSLSYQQFLDMARRQNIDLTQSERERLARAMVSSDSVRNNRIFRRSNVPGYSKDIYRVLSEFAVTMANKIAYSEFSDAINSAAQGNVVQVAVKQGIPSVAVDHASNLWAGDGPQAGFYRNLADQRIDYVMQRDPGGDWSRNARAAASVYFLGGSLSAGMVQLSSLPMNTVPYLYQHTGYANAFGKVLGAFRDTAANFNALRDIARLKDTANVKIGAVDGVQGLRQALIEAAQDGTVLDTEIYHIMGTTRGGVLSKSPRVQKAMDAWMSPFRLAEQMNRFSTFIAAYKVGAEGNMQGDELYKFAQEAVYNTQFRYDEANRPGLAHNPIWAILFTFKSYPIFMGEMIVSMFKQSPRAGVMMLLSLSAAAGINGLPFAEDLQDLIDTIAQRIFGSSFNSKRAIRNVLKSASEAVTGADLSGVFMNGMVNEMTGMSFASRVGLGNMIPGTRAFTADADYKKTAEEIIGPVASLVSGAGAGIISLSKGEPIDALRSAAPLAVQNVVKSYDQFTKGYASDSSGRKLIDVSSWDAFAQAAGFSSGKLAAAYDLDRVDRQTQAFYKEMQKDFTKNIVQAVQAHDVAKVNEAYHGVVEWNKAHPDMPMVVGGSSLRHAIGEAGLPLNERTYKMLPRALRQQSIAGEFAASR